MSRWNLDELPLCLHSAAHDDEYRRALKDWQSFVEAATLTIIEVDETIPELPVKDVIFRIYRDVRFSKVKTPYKVRLVPAIIKVVTYCTIASLLSCLVTDWPEGSLRLLLHPLRTRVVIHRRRPVASRSCTHHEAPPEH